MLVNKKEFDQKNRRANRKKDKRNNNKSTLDLIPIKNFSKRDYTQFVDNIYSETYKLNTVALNDISQSENNKLMSNFARLLRMYDDSIKIVSSNFYTNTIQQILYWQEQLEIAEEQEDIQRVQVINEKIVTLKIISTRQINKEHYINIYAKSEEELQSKINLFTYACGSLIYSVPLTKEQKSKIFEDFNNPHIFDKE